MDTHPQLSLTETEIPQTRLEPKLWVKEFAVFKSFETREELRRITLRPGLNIVWARDAASGASGHAAGKSTFARMLRYLLGDATYGSDDFKTSLRVKLPDACIVGEVYVDGVPWLIVRPLARSGYHWSAKEKTWDALFDESTKHQDFQEFTDALAEAFISPLASVNFPGTERKIEWGYLLQWLTRDQDARYAHLLEWRPGGSDGTEGRILGAGEKTNLVRMVLGLLTDDEQKLQRSHAELLTEQKDLDGEIPKLNYSRDRALAGLKEVFPELTGKQVDFATVLGARKDQLQTQVDELTKALTEANRHDGAGDILPARLAAQTAKREFLKGDLDERSLVLRRLRLNLSHQNGQLSQEEFQKQSAALGDMPGKCSNSLEMAHKFRCPIAPALMRDELQDARLQQAKSVAVDIAEQINFLDQERQPIAKQHQDAVLEEVKIQTEVNKLRNAHIETRHRLLKELTDARTLLESVARALSDQEDIHIKRARLKKLATEINESSKNLAAKRKDTSKQLSKLSAEYSKVASHLLQQTVRGEVQFHSDEIVPSLNYDGDMSSAALVTLRLLIFDLACLAGSAGPFPLHPGFLLHDSPREADLSAVIYRRIFSFIAGERENEAVQYIIATTESPPEDRQSEPWLTCELSSAEPGQRFLKTIV